MTSRATARQHAPGRAVASENQGRLGLGESQWCASLPDGRSREPASRSPRFLLRSTQHSGGTMQTDNAAARTGQTDETDRLISSDKVEGTTVYNHNGESLGTIDHLMIDKFTGKVEYAVMSTGGFLGIGESYS